MSVGGRDRKAFFSEEKKQKTFFPTLPTREHYELHSGFIVRMAPKRWSHAKTKARFLVAMSEAVRAGGLACDVVGDGRAV